MTGVDAMSHELSAILPADVARDCANNIAWALQGEPDPQIWKAIKDAVSARRRHLTTSETDDAFILTCIAYVETAFDGDGQFHAWSMVMASNGFPWNRAQRLSWLLKRRRAA